MFARINNEEENVSATITSNSFHSDILTFNEEVFIQYTAVKNNKFKNIKKKTSIEAQVLH